MYCAKSHQGGGVHLWSATHSANSGALSGLAAVLAARLAAVLAARLAAVLAARLAAGLAARLVAGARPHILIYNAVRLAANKKNPKIYRRIQNVNTYLLHLAIYKVARMKKNLMRLQLTEL
jgi:hypothetical protein